MVIQVGRKRDAVGQPQDEAAFIDVNVALSADLVDGAMQRGEADGCAGRAEAHAEEAVGLAGLRLARWPGTVGRFAPISR